MTNAHFAPGFRLSITDLLVLAAGAIGVFWGSRLAWWCGLVVGLAVLHFFLFCNVFRMSRPLELIWAVVFVGLAGASARWGTPGWVATAGGALVLAAVLVGIEMRRPSYHGVGWRRINPGLPVWWQERNQGGTGKG